METFLKFRPLPEAEQLVTAPKMPSHGPRVWHPNPAPALQAKQES